MNEAKILIGDALSRLGELEDASIQTCVTSPPYWGLRDYGNDNQLGLEATPQEFVENLCRVFDEVWRVLSDDGTVWVNLGDSYRNKSLAGVPWRFAFAMNDRGWYLRQDIVWSKPNPMPESVRDRCTKSHEYIFLFSKSENYFFDSDSIAEPIAESSVKRYQQNIVGQLGSDRAHAGLKTMKALAPKIRKSDLLRGGFGREDIPGQTNHVGPNVNEEIVEPLRNKRSVWNVSVARYSGAHFAVYPPELIKPCILAGSKPGDFVLDPFSGSGTTGEVALLNDRNYVGVELNPDYAELSRQRLENSLGMFAEVRLNAQSG